MRMLCGLLLIGTAVLTGAAQAQARQDGRFDGNEYFGDSSEGFFGDPSSGHHGMPLLELDEPVRSYQVTRGSETPYLTLPPERIIEFDSDLYGD